MALTPEGTPYVESTDLVANYPAASLSLANRVDLVGVLPFADSAARATAIPSPTDGQFTYLQDTNSTEFYNGSAFEALGGKILQVVRATDTTNRTTNSTTYVDVTGASITISPKKSTSAILVISTFSGRTGVTNLGSYYDLTTSGNTSIIGGTGPGLMFATSGGIFLPLTIIGYDLPGTTSATTYKMRFKMDAGASLAYVNGAVYTTQLYAIEVSA